MRKKADKRPWAAAMARAKKDVARELTGDDQTWEQMVGAEGVPSHIREYAYDLVQDRLCESYGNHCRDISLEIAAGAAWIAAPKGGSPDKGEVAEKVRAATERVLSNRTTAEILGELSDPELDAMNRKPGLIRAFYGTAVHRAVALALDEMYPGEFRYKASHGVDFEHRGGAMVELTTGGQVDAHYARGGSYYSTAYVAYDIHMTVGQR
ncbi:MAG TPA: hypothetical protein VM677_17625 [Actinokineospora sp.]|jgi:hypothetical protein|nr:hypothetical protein [Actinokineospora sp.]